MVMRWLVVIGVWLLIGVGLTRSVAAEGPGLPAQLYLPAQHYWQTRNNCGPTAVAMAASVFGIRVDPERARWALRPEVESVGMDPARVPGYVLTLGLGARPRVNGELDTVRRLLANDVPVIVTQWLSASQPIEHYRLVVGYDLNQRALLVHDSTRGPLVWLSEVEFNQLWSPTGQAYIPVYRPDQLPTVASIIGQDWDDTWMYNRALARAVDEVWRSPRDAWTWARVGTYAYALGDSRTAQTAWQVAGSLGLPQGEDWLPGWLAAATLELGDYFTALGYADRALTRYPTSAGLHLVRGRALQGLGRTSEAVGAFRRALELEPQFTAARAALDRVVSQ
jgi:hypothetical protein